MLIFYTLFIFLQLTNGEYFSSMLSTNYDMLIFAQVWPLTSCYEWEEISPSHKCNLPPNEEWSIHGLWPTKNGSIGPFYCNYSLHFDVSALSSIKRQLEVKWIDVHKGSKAYEFWKHEWEKHGTCSVDLESLNTEKKYFQKVLNLLDEFDMKNVLTKASIIPNQKYFLQDYLDGVYKILGKRAYVECIQNLKKNEIYLSELRICFNRQFELIDCNGILHFPSNCNHSKQIIYPGSVPDLIKQPLVIQI